MMNFRFLLLFLLVATFSACSAPEVPEAEDALVTEGPVDTTLQAMLFERAAFFPDGTQLALAFLDSNHTAFYGLERQDGRLVTTDNRDALFEIGSITKAFTATLLAQLAGEGIVDPDDSLQHFFTFPLKETARGDKAVRLRHLANHTSGMARIPEDMTWDILTHRKNPYRDYGEKRLLNYLEKKMHLAQPPGDAYGYSNLGMGLLGYILSRETGSSYEALLDTRIFGPLGMESSTSVLNEADADRLVKGRNRQGKVTPNWDLNVLVAAGGILSSAGDIARFVRYAWSDDPAVVRTRRVTANVSDQMAIGLGWHIRTNAQGVRQWWHNGATGGYRSCLAFDPETQQAVIILSNVSGGHPQAGNIDNLCFDLLDSGW